MSEADRERWDARYAAPGDRMGAEPKALLVAAEAWLPRSGSALDLACGEGQAAVWLARRGLDVTGVDLSAVGLDKARARAAGLAVDWVQADLDDWDPGDRRWDVVSCLHFLDRRLIPRIRRAVRPGGLLVIEVLTEEASAAYGAAPNELLRWFVDWRVLRYEEAESAALIARRP